MARMTLRWRSFGVAFLVCLGFALPIGLAETFLADLRFMPEFRGLVFGANLHALMALVAVAAARLLHWNAAPQRFPIRALRLFLLFEGAVVGGYWLTAAPFAPPFDRSSGKLFAAGAGIFSAVVGFLIALAISRPLERSPWARRAKDLTGPLGLLLAGLLIVGNAVALVGKAPRTQRIPVREESAHLARPDVFVILIDTLRRDHLSFFGYERPTSPNIDAFLGQSFVFASAYAPGNKTLPTVASIFSGLYPTSHGVTDPSRGLPEEAWTLAEHFKSYGYATAAFVANRIVTARNGFAQGFDLYFPPSPPWWTCQGRTFLERAIDYLRVPHDASRAGRINTEFLRWLDKTPGEPHFGYVHYMEPHSPYDPPRSDIEAVAPGAPEGPKNPPFYHEFLPLQGCIDWECLDSPPRLEPDRLKGMVARYDGEIRAVDRSLGRLIQDLESRGLLRTSHILLLCDHGEEFFDHGGWFHGHSIYEEVAGCLLAYRPPGGLDSAKVIEYPVATLDVFTSLLMKLGIERPKGLQAQPLPELLGLPADGRSRPVLCELPPSLFSLRLGRWKLVRRGSPKAPQFKLFDMLEDPLELRDLSGQYPDTLALLKGYLEGITAEHAQAGLRHAETVLDEEMLRRLKNLGYLN